jgi:hypothetical protein
MLHGYIWRLTSNPVLAVGMVQAQNFMTTYLAMGETAITADSYFGVKLPGCFCPNFAYQFRVASNWPTRPQDPVNLLIDIYGMYN